MKKSIKLFTTVMVCMAMALCVSCKKDNTEPGGGNTGGGGTQTVATVTTEEVTEITKTTAVCGGEVKSENGWAVTERGVCWSTEPNPTPSDSHTVDGEGMGAFTSEMTGLEPGTKYYVRAYAKNAAGIGFGAERSFTTLENGGGGGGTQTVATVTTNEVTEITQTTAICGGEVTSDGGAAVTACGVCWSTSQNPTVSDSHTTDGSGTGSFTSNITGLTENTTYYVRAYATNSEGTSYGEQRSFTTSQNITSPTVTTNNVTDITQTTATCGGEVTSDGGATVTARGVCWGTEPNPTPSDNCTVDGEGVGAFTSEITGLEPDTKYYVRAYAKNAAGTGFGAEQSFTTLENGGGGGGRFSVSPTTTVEFARGNLYWDGSAFRFEANQWSFADTWNASHVSHFFWSKRASVTYASSYSDSGVSTSDVFFTNATQTTANPSFKVSGEAAGTWRTLSKAEWDYLLNSRTGASSLRAWVTLTDVSVSGLVILPDGSSATASGITTSSALAGSGAVFLPAAGYRDWTDVNNVGSNGYYCSSTPNGWYHACYVFFNSGNALADYNSRYYGRAVRLVR